MSTTEGLIPRRYAKALYKVGLERQCTDRLYALMQNLAAAFAADPDLAKAIDNPYVELSDKDALLTAAAQADSKDVTFADFLKLLAENRRIPMAALIADAYVLYYRQERHIRRVEVISAAPLDHALLGRIKELVEKHLDGDSMEFSTKVDPALVGGFVVNIDNERLDASVSRRFKELRQSLLK